MRVQPTRIESIDKAKPGLRQFVDIALDGLKPLEWISTELKRQFEEAIPITTLSNYKQKRWLMQKKRIESIREHATAIMDLLDARGVSQVRQAMLFERIQTAMDAGVALDPAFMLVEERRRAELDLKRQQLEHEQKKLQLEIERLESQQDAVRQAVAAAGTPEFDAQAALAQISAVIGVGGALEERVETA
jgi:hypothetical protein